MRIFRVYLWVCVCSHLCAGKLGTADGPLAIGPSVILIGVSVKRPCANTLVCDECIAQPCQAYLLTAFSILQHMVGVGSERLGVELFIELSPRMFALLK